MLADNAQKVHYCDVNIVYFKKRLGRQIDVDARVQYGGPQATE